MRFTIAWLKEFLATDASVDEIIKKLNSIGLEVDSVHDKGAEYKDFKIAKILQAEKHPAADKLRLCQVDDGNSELQIVCGASNARAGIKVVLAPVGSVIPVNKMKIKPSKIRGVESYGMLCSSEELDLGAGDPGTIMEVDDHLAIGDSFAEVFGLNDVEIEVEITPNRGDCLGVYGIARDLAAAGLGTLKQLDIKDVEPDFETDFTVQIIEKEKCPAFSARVIQGVKNPESPDWLKKYIKASGSKPISALVDITNYIQLSFGRPLHAYDKKILSGNKLLVRNAKKQESILTLNDDKVVLEEDILVVADEKTPHCLGGIIGGKESGCTLDTEDLVLEAAIFDHVYIANAARKLKISSDSSYRFERKIDQTSPILGQILASQLIKKYCGGKFSQIIYSGEKNFPTKEIEFPISMVKSLGGLDIDKSEIIEILRNLGFEVQDKSEILSLKAPSWRRDIEGKADIVEEVIRMHGLDDLPAVPLPALDSINFKPLSFKQERVKRLARKLAMQGFKEIVSWSFMSKDLFAEFSDKKPVALLNPISSDLNVMRPSMLPNLLSAIVTNQNRQFMDLAFFEVGNIFETHKEDGYKASLGIVKVGNVMERNPHTTTREYDVFDVKADLFNVISDLGLNPANLRYEKTNVQYFHPTRQTALKLGKQTIALFGEIHPRLLEIMGIRGRVVAAELDLESIPLPRKKSALRNKLLLNDFPVVERDFAFLIDVAVSASQIEQAINKVDKDLLKSINIFDIYQGKNIEPGKKSIALSVSLQKTETLTEKEISEYSSKLISSIEKLGGLLRD